MPADSNNVRLRFAPSPTGRLHIGNARTALFNYLYARRMGGAFVLRIEDTDVERSREEFVQGIIEDLRWLGLDWDEGPDVGGDYGPYRQSQRLQIYRDYAEDLMARGLAYRCYCTPEELEERRKLAIAAGKAPRYDNRCRNLSPEQRETYEKEGRPFSIRFKLSGEKVVVDDLVYGRMEFDTSLMGDFVVMKSDGTPTYHFAVVVDDALMRITHVLRGEGHISNTPLHIELFRAIGHEPPLFAHMSHTRGSDGSKLSKRHGAFSLKDYRDMGYLPEAIANYIALLGWSPGTKDEIISMEEAIRRFDIRQPSRASSKFDPAKLTHICGEYIRRADIERLTDMAADFLMREGDAERALARDRRKLQKIVEIVRGHMSHMSQIVEEVQVFIKQPSLDSRFVDELRKSIDVLKSAVENIEASSPDDFLRSLKRIQAETGAKGRNLYMPLRIALTGEEHGPELHLIAGVLGTEECRSRIKSAIEKCEER